MRDYRDSLYGYRVRKDSEANTLLEEFERKMLEAYALLREAQEITRQMQMADGYLGVSP